MKRLKTIALLLLVAALLCACHAVDDTLSTPTVEGNETTAPTTAATVPTVPAEPTMPKELVSESRKDGLIYTPHTHHYLNSGLPCWTYIQFALDEDCYPGKTITYDVSTNFGFFRVPPDYTRSSVYKNLENNKTYGWMTDSLRGFENVLLEDGAIFVDAVIRADGVIVGYGIFEINGDGKGNFALMRSETVIFPMFNGKCQEVSEQYVAEKLAEMKQTVTPFDWEEKVAEYDAYLTAYWDNYWKNYYEERKPLDTSAIIQITSSMDVLEEDPAVSQMNVVNGYHCVNYPIIVDPWLEDFYIYLPKSNEHAAIYLMISMTDRDLLSPNEQYEVRTNYGGFFEVDGGTGGTLVKYVGQLAFIEYSWSLAWVGPYDIPDIDPAVTEKPNRIWIDAIFRDGEYIIGFAIYEVVPWGDHNEGYTIVNAYDESYKLIDGRFQSITEEFVNQRIEAYHRYAESNS